VPAIRPIDSSRTPARNGRLTWKLRKMQRVEKEVVTALSFRPGSPVAGRARSEEAGKSDVSAMRKPSL